MQLSLEGPVSSGDVRAIRIVTPLAILLGALALWILGQPFAFPVDDAYITLNNARALLTGTDPNFGVSPLVGATSPAHLALVALACRILPPVAAGFTVAAFGVAAYGWGVAELALRQGLSRLGAAVLLVVALGGGYAAFQLFNGLETPWAMAAVTWAIVLAERPNRGLAILAGTLPFVRPELAILAALLLARQAWLRRDLGAIAIDAVLALLAAAPWLAWSWLETGAVVANTLAAKAAFFADPSLGTQRAVAEVGKGLFYGLGPGLAAIAIARRGGLALALWGFVLLFAAAFMLAFPQGLTHNSYRYCYVLMPVALWSLRRGPMLLLIAVIWVGGALGGGVAQSVSMLSAGQATSRDALATGVWIRSHLPPDAVILVHDVGGVAVAARQPMIDMVGLKTRWASAYHQQYTAPSAGRDRGKALDAIARRSGAQYAVIGEMPFWSDLAKDLRAAGWTLTVVRPAPMATGYNVYRLTPPAAR